MIRFRSDFPQLDTGPNLSSAKFEVSGDWQSSFNTDVDAKVIKLPQGLQLELPLPSDWNQILMPLPECVHSLWISPDNTSDICICTGPMEPGLSVEAIAGSVVNQLRAKGAEVPVVVSEPLERSTKPRSAHAMNFFARVPGEVLAIDSPTPVEYFKALTMVEVSGQWVSVETTAFGPGCNPLEEMKPMMKIHGAFSIRSSQEN